MDTTEQAVSEFQALMQDPAARQAFVEVKAQQAQAGAGRHYEHILRVVGSRAWAIEESVLMLIVDVLTFRAYGGRLSAEEIDSRLEGSRRQVSQQAPVGVARVPISGVLVPRASSFDAMSGGSSAEKIREQIQQAAASPQVGSIVLDVDSPGGMVDGIPELAADIRAAREVKPVVAVANTEAMSAAYWLASQADRFFASPSARVGSIGVFSAHEDRSAQAEQKGVKTTLISAGEFKTEGNPFGPLSEEGKAHMQSLVDSMYTMFLNDVAKGREIKAQDVKENFGQGRFFDAKGALDRGMIDGIATIDQVIQGEFDNLRKQQAQVAAMQAAAQTGYVRSVHIAEAAPVADEQGELWKTWALADATGTESSDPGPSSPEPEPVPVVADEPETAFDIAASTDDEDDEILSTLDEALATLDEAAKLEAAVDESPWDGNKAMGQCNSAGDFRSICAGEHNAGEPDQRQHWALPHHYLGRGPNAAGVRNALSRLGQTQDLKNRAAAQSHLDSHMREINPGGANSSGDSRQEREIASLEAELRTLST